MDKLVHVGIPTLNEVSSIGQLTKQVDGVLAASFQGDQIVIINADNPSTDGTQAAFLAATTESRKETLQSLAVGKGRNFRMLFEHAVDSGADVLVTIDADLEIVGDDWLSQLASPILRGDADLSIPLYPRFWYDGNLTNQIVCPLVAAVTGVPIRQPIAGEFAFSPRAMGRLLQMEWPSHTYGFGTDIACVLELLSNQQRVIQVPLSVGKIHSWRSDTADEVEIEMDSKFQAIVCSMLHGLRRFSPQEPPAAFPSSPPLGRTSKRYETSHLVETARRSLERGRASPMWNRLVVNERDVNSNGLLSIDEDEWASILARLYSASQLEPQHLMEFVSVLRVLFFHRIAHVLPSLTNELVEPMVNHLKDLVYDRVRNANGGERLHGEH